MTKLTRRPFLGLGAAALGVAAGASPFAAYRALGQGVALPEIPPIPEAMKGSGELRVANYGGTMQEAQRRAYFEPFERMTGIRVRDFAGADTNKVKAMVETGNVEWDVVQLSQGSVTNLMKRGDYFEKIDYDLVDTANIDPAYRAEYALDMLVWAEVMAYRTDAFKGAVPVGWKDFWDTRKFPGDRALGGAGPSNPELEFAAMAAGADPAKVYPIDIARAFTIFDAIKPSVVKWWETGAVPVQLLTDREVVMTSVWNGRMAALQAAGVPAAVSWDQGLLKRDAWAIPKNAPNRVNAQKFVAFSTMAVPQARVSALIPYGSVNAKSPEYTAPKQLALLPSAPEIAAKLVPYDYQWWSDHRDEVVARWNKWVLA